MNNMPTKARWTTKLATLLVASTVFLGACAGDLTTPSASRVAPTGPNKALVGVIDGIYTFTVQPGTDYTMPLGKSSLSIPANSICALGTSGYGDTYWNAPCTPETNPVTITAIVKNALTDNPSIEFQPALRFNPDNTVGLFIYVTNAATLSNMTVMKYCNALAVCTDESINDPSLATIIDASQGLVHRRIKHFSGYIVAE